MSNAIVAVAGETVVDMVATGSGGTYRALPGAARPTSRWDWPGSACRPA